MTEQKIIVDTNLAFTERVNNLLRDGWRVVPGSVAMSPLNDRDPVRVMVTIVLERETPA